MGTRLVIYNLFMVPQVRNLKQLLIVNNVEILHKIQRGEHITIKNVIYKRL